MSWKDRLSVKDFPKELQPIYSVLDNYHNTNSDGTNLTVPDLANILFATTTKDKEYYQTVLTNLETLDVSTTTTGVLLKSIVTNKVLKDLAINAYDLTEGRGSLDTLHALIEQLKGEEVAGEKEEFQFVSDDIDELLNETYRKPGLRWRLDALNKMLGSLRGGDFGFVFARPETGKTTLLASETTFMAEQLEEKDGPVVWINNEEKGSKVKIRSYQAALGATLAQINSNTAKARAAYLNKTKGKHMIFDATGTINKATVEKLCRRYKPSLLVFDQIDKIVGFEADREDLKLGAMYQWARELAKEHDCAIIAVCQADGSGEGQKWLTMGNVANAKTAKQAEADWILGVGKSAEPGYDNVRYLHLSKNKLSGDQDSDPNMRHGKKEVVIRPETARYEDLQ